MRGVGPCFPQLIFFGRRNMPTWVTLDMGGVVPVSNSLRDLNIECSPREVRREKRYRQHLYVSVPSRSRSMGGGRWAPGTQHKLSTELKSVHVHWITVACNIFPGSYFWHPLTAFGIRNVITLLPSAGRVRWNAGHSQSLCYYMIPRYLLWYMHAMSYYA